jgi:integrase
MIFNDPNTTTKTDRTKSRYTKQAQQLRRRYEKEVGGTDEQFVQWLISLKPSITPASWRSYKSAVVWNLTDENHNALADILLSENSDNCLPRTTPNKKTSAKKKKSVTEREERIVLEYFQNDQNRSFWAIRAAAFFRATLLVGLRPVEWQDAKLHLNPTEGVDGPFPVLRVKNAKATNGRSHGEYRHLHLHEMDRKELSLIQVAVLYADQENPKGWLTPSGKAESWDAFYNRLRQYVGKAVDNIFPPTKKGISIYSCRHQFIADLKVAGYKREEIAALVGHAVDDTATVHYGRKRNGRSGKSGLPISNPNEVKRVRTVYGATSTPQKTCPNI